MEIMDRGITTYIPTKPSCLNCNNRLREGVTGMICKRFPEGIPEEIWDNLKNLKYKPCDKFEFEPLNNKYNWVRDVGFGIFYLILFAYCVTTDDADSAITSSLTLLLCAVVVYEMCLHELKVERNHWLSSWRYCRMLLENEKEKNR